MPIKISNDLPARAILESEHIFVMNFSDDKVKINLNGEYKNTVSGEVLTGETELDVCGYLVLE